MTMTLEQVRDYLRGEYTPSPDKRKEMADAINAHLTQPRAVPDGWSSAVSDALAVIKDVAQFHGQLPIGVYQHIQPRLAALLAAAPPIDAPDSKR